jgi:RNA polymerase sigma-B factor
MKLTAQSGRSPIVHEPAQYMELSVEEVLEGLEASAAHHSTSLEVPRERPDGESGALADTLGGNDAELELVENRATVRAAKPREKFAGTGSRSSRAERSGNGCTS